MERTNRVTCAEWAKNAKTQRATAVDEGKGRRDRTRARDLSRKRRDGAVRDREESDGLWARPQRTHHRRRVVAGLDQKDAVAGAAQRPREAAAEVAPARNDDFR
jgi:hypothetical protein